MGKVSLMLRHRWHDHRDSRHALTDDAAQRIEQRIAQSETQHTGEVCVVVESALPLSYLWRVSPKLTLPDAIRQRALSWFGRLRVWDTEHNNGVLIYLLLAERHVELVADRAVARLVSDADWQILVDGLTTKLRAGAFEQALHTTLDEVSAHLTRHFPDGDTAALHNELSDRVIRC